MEDKTARSHVMFAGVYNQQMYLFTTADVLVYDSHKTRPGINILKDGGRMGILFLGRGKSGYGASAGLEQ